MQRRLTRAYKKALSEISLLLYELDPLGVYGAPYDEYDTEAGKLLRHLEKAEDAKDVEELLHDAFDLSPEPQPLVAETALGVWNAWQRYLTARS